MNTINFNEEPIYIPKQFDNDNLRYNDYEKIIEWLNSIKKTLPMEDYIKFLQNQKHAKEDYLVNAAYEELAKLKKEKSFI